MTKTDIKKILILPYLILNKISDKTISCRVSFPPNVSSPDDTSLAECCKHDNSVEDCLVSLGNGCF